jgi:hypothetical protein
MPDRSDKERIFYFEDPRFVLVEPKGDKATCENVMVELRRRRDDLLKQSPEESDSLKAVTDVVWNVLADYFHGKVEHIPVRLSVRLMGNGINTGAYSDAFGTVSEAEILVRDFSAIQIDSLRFIQLLKLILHEAYHSTAIRRLKVSTVGTNVAVNILSEGVHSDPNSAGAFEEGLAVFFENETYKRLIAHLPSDGVAHFSRAVAGPLLKDNERLECIVVVNAEALGPYSSNYGTAIMPYSACLELVELLAKEIPNFLILVEQSRVDNKPLGLARAIEARFGDGSFRNLLTSRMEQASELLGFFKGRLTVHS